VWLCAASGTKISSFDPPLTAVSTAYPAEPFLPFSHPPIKLPSLAQLPAWAEVGYQADSARARLKQQLGCHRPYGPGLPEVGLLLIELIRASGIDRALSTALALWRKPLAVRDSGKILLDLAIMLVGWGLPGRCEPAPVRIGRVRRVA
jgi:hypothetical protein